MLYTLEEYIYYTLQPLKMTIIYSDCSPSSIEATLCYQCLTWTSRTRRHDAVQSGWAIIAFYQSLHYQLCSGVEYPNCAEYDLVPHKFPHKCCKNTLLDYLLQGKT